MKSKLILILGIGIGVAFLYGIIGSLPDSNKETPESVFQVTLADPSLYQDDGVFTENFDIVNGTYAFRFVPNGDSPQTMTISVIGDSLDYVEDFELEGISHETGVSTYYTWDYLGEKKLHVSDNQNIQIRINPHGNLLGPVSVEIINIK